MCHVSYVVVLPVPFAHALRVGGSDVLVHDLLPASATEPTPEEALDLFDLGQVRVLLLLHAVHHHLVLAPLALLAARRFGYSRQKTPLFL